MSDKPHGSGDAQSLFESWIKTGNEFWSTAFKAWSSPPAPKTPAAADSERESSESSRSQEALEAIQKSWRTISSAMEEPETLRSIFSGIGTLPEIFIRLAQTGWTGFLDLQGQWLEKAARLGQSSTAYNFDNLDAEAFHAWSETYEREFRQLLNIPQLGLARGYQERFNQGLDKFNRFQAAMSEFLYLIYMPMEKSTKVMQDELEVRARAGEMPETPKDYYALWIKILEGHYMTLFKSGKYTRTLSRTLDAMGEYMVARKRIVEDLLQSLPVPTHSEVDELYKQIYLLKKRLRALEKESGKR